MSKLFLHQQSILAIEAEDEISQGDVLFCKQRRSSVPDSTCVQYWVAAYGATILRSETPVAVCFKLTSQ